MSLQIAGARSKTGTTMKSDCGKRSPAQTPLALRTSPRPRLRRLRAGSTNENSTFLGTGGKESGGKETALRNMLLGHLTSRTTPRGARLSSGPRAAALEMGTFAAQAATREARFIFAPLRVTGCYGDRRRGRRDHASLKLSCGTAATTADKVGGTMPASKPRAEQRPPYARNIERAGCANEGS